MLMTEVYCQCLRYFHNLRYEVSIRTPELLCAMRLQTSIAPPRFQHGDCDMALLIGCNDGQRP